MLAFELTQVEIRTEFDFITLQLDLQIIQRKLTALNKQVDYCLIEHDKTGAAKVMRVIEEWQFTYEEQIVILNNLYGNI
ncbi:gp002 [Erwinia phage vB_EamP-S6]|uniref:Gp002 n=1 Tax=Erwinia phage vB_EamP-S6 TaxID=1051675 RepID=G0YQ94_9CAUD|nr:gp002 [Erwinia phage vB_EamP-S6]AEJ81521.1 gp002 [Erwinia phage vB_EamP-S6]